ncbi:MAG: hypothetical protein HFG27_13610 [Provencibacterium sp.]|nr:hypothetical protein [Provencibacterium sp.]
MASLRELPRGCGFFPWRLLPAEPLFFAAGGGGVYDRYQDIALAYRSLQELLEEQQGRKVLHGFSPQLLFDALNIPPDWEKLRYYILLDELF